MGDETSGVGGRCSSKALSARFVETVSAPGKYFDGHGLFLRVSPSGSKQWVQRIMIQGKRTEIGLGSPPAVSLATARKVALDNRGQAMLGGDPLAEKRRKRNVLTFEEAVEAYLATKLTEFRNDKHRRQWRSTLDSYALPILGRKAVGEVGVQDVLTVLKPLWQEKTETASRLRGRIENVLSWATVSGHREGANPARWKGNLSELLAKPSKVIKSDNQPALALADVQAWWSELLGREGMAAIALRFLVMTAARSGEVRGMTWDEVNLGEPDPQGRRIGIWTIPASRMKNGRQHRVPLPAAATALLAGLPRLNGCPYVFFAPRGGMMSDMTISAAMRRMNEARVSRGLPGYLDPESKRPAVPHGLRSTFRQWAAVHGYPRDMAELALAHWIGSEVERAYQRADMLDRRREMMEAWVDFVVGGLVSKSDAVAKQL